MKSALLLTLALVAACAAPAPEQAPVLTEVDHGRRVAVAQGDALTIRLPGNGTTGYVWRVVARPPMLNPAGEEYLAPEQAPSGPAVAGAGGVQVFVFRAASPGQGRLELAERPVWAPQARATQSFRLSVTVTERP